MQSEGVSARGRGTLMTTPQDSDGGISVLTGKEGRDREVVQGKGRGTGDGGHPDRRTPTPERGPRGNDHMPWAPSSESCQGGRAHPQGPKPHPSSHRHRAPPGSGTGRWVRLHTVTEAATRKQKAALLALTSFFSKTGTLELRVKRSPVTSPSPSVYSSSGWSAHPASYPASSGAGPFWLGPGTCPWSHCQRRGLLPG